MSDAIIKVDGLGKKYIIAHEQISGGYTALRDVLSNKAKSVLKRREQLPPKEEFWALKDVSFEIKKGEAVGIIGRNGAGKSTLLKLLSRITEPSTGRIELNGRVASLLEVGTGFHPELTGRENIFLNGAILGMSRTEIRKKFDEIVEFSGVEKFLDTPVKRYSSGMYVRLAFAVAAHLEPEILVVDEVLAVGDAEFQKKCLGKMSEVSNKEGRTVLFVSHNMAAVSNLCQTAMFLSQGKLVSQAKVDDIVSLYLQHQQSTQGKVSAGQIKYEQRYNGAEFVSVCTTRKGEVADSFYINEEINVEIEYEVLKDGETISPSIHILDSYGTCVFGTFNAPSATVEPDPFYGIELKKGIYKTVCSIPAFLLNNKTYHISCFLVPRIFTELAIAREVLSFNVEDTGEMRKEYTGDWIGLTRPRMHWNTQKL